MKKKGLIAGVLMLLLCSLFLASCGGKKWTPEPVSDPQLEVTYQKMLVLPVTISAQFAKDYPQAAADLRDGLVVSLEESKRFQVKLVDEVPAQTELHTLVVKLEIADMRIASTAARFFGGAFVGSSYVTVGMTLTDGHTGQVIRNKPFSTQNNAMAAAWALNDASITKDMGRIIGDYITAVVPQAGFPAKPVSE